MEELFRDPAVAAGDARGGLYGSAFSGRRRLFKTGRGYFLNLLFVTVVPLVFFAIAISVAAIEQKINWEKYWQ